MATRKDLLKAQSFMSRRMVAAFVDRDPDDPTPPLRRVGTASFVSVLLGVILLAGTALIGMLRPGSGGDTWQEEGVVISDTSAGMLFVYSDGDLIPMADVASARLLAGGADAAGPPAVVKVSTEALRGTQQSAMLGIPDAPRQLPAAGDVTAAPLRLCSSEPTSAGNRFVTLELDADPDEGEKGAFVAKDPRGAHFLISHGKAHELWQPQGDNSPLVGGLEIVEPGGLWLSALPVGDPITPWDIQDRGATPTKNTLNMEIGSLAQVKETGGGTRYYVQLDGGLSQVSYLDMRLIQEVHGALEPRVISESQFSEAMNTDVPRSGNMDIDLAKPSKPAGFGSIANASFCATFPAGDTKQVSISIGRTTPDVTSQEPLLNAVDHIETDPLSGVLLKNANNAVDDSATYLVLDGHSYPIPDLVSRRALGYGDVVPVAVPPQLITAIQPGLAGGVNLSLQTLENIAGSD